MQVDQKLFHDAALVYGIEEKSYPLNITLFEKMVRKFKYLAKLYLDDTLEDLVKWPKLTSNPHKCPMTGLFECPTVKKQSSSGYLIGIIVVIVVILIILGMFKEDVARKLCRCNRVHPL